MTLPFGALAAVLALSLGVWTFFYLASGVPLEASETAVVVGLCAIVVWAARWALGRLLAARKNGGPTP